MFTVQREMQKKFVDKVYQWAQDQISKMDYLGKNPDKPMRPQTGKISSRPFSSDKRPFSGATSKLLRPTSGYPLTIGGDTMAETTLNLSFDTRPNSAKLQIIEEDGTVLSDGMKDMHSYKS